MSIFVRIFTDSADIIRYVLFTMGGVKYLLLLVLPLMFLPLLGCTLLLPGLGDLAANLLSSNPMPRNIFSYHTVTLIPVFVVSAIYGARRLDLIFKKPLLEKTVVPVLLVSLIISWLSFPFFNFPGSYSVWKPKRIVIFHDENYEKVQALIKPEMSLSVQANIGAHFTQRHEIFRYPNKIGDVDAVVLRLDSPTLRTKNESQYFIGSLGNHLQMSPVEYLDTIESLLESDIYEKKIWADPWLVFMKGERTTTGNDEVLHKINSLKAKWE